jgi:hypothetical protein
MLGKQFGNDVDIEIKVPSGMWLEFLHGVIPGSLTIAYYAARSIG